MLYRLPISGLVAAVLSLVLVGSAAAQDDYRAEMQEIVDDLNDGDFRSFVSALSRRDMMTRIASHHPVDPQLAGAMNDQFDEIIEGAYNDAFPSMGQRKNIGKLVNFELSEGSGHALVRYKLPKYNYQYLRFDLSLDGRDRLVIDDWVNFMLTRRFSKYIAEGFVAVSPSEPGLHSLVTGIELNGSDLFMVREAAKAARESDHPRVLEIVADMRDHVQQHPYIVKQTLWAARISGDIDRYEAAVQQRLSIDAEDPLYALAISDYFMTTQQFDRALSALAAFQKGIGIDDGAVLSRMSALALAAGLDEDAEGYALRATEFEPELELGWWSLLRARARRDDIPGSIEVLTRLEDDFDERLDASKLKRDRFGAFHKIADSQAFKDWREQRN